MKRLAALTLTTLLLAACQQATPPRTATPASPTQIAAQLAEYQEKSDALVHGVELAFTPGVTSQALNATALSDVNRSKLEQLRQQAVARFPELLTQPAWLAESSQLVGVQEAQSVTSNLDGLFVIATVATDDPQKTAWVATITVDMTKGTLVRATLNDELTGGYVPPAMKHIGPDGKVPMIRRSYDVSQPDITVAPVAAMSVPREPQSAVFVYDGAGVLQR
ncbi:hypothetical protein K7W42_12900 [Deinococcus sp. HMF7604]|uniref:hypothetical protein n=1 Tax=Deinococcus betulae TaxID=2873312 RepID=UPI001CD013C8|nr:hypothetical protein [Deinococcus betulae]MBZ9751755.1 hypothetical protein [Deinococcus betulae]